MLCNAVAAAAVMVEAVKCLCNIVLKNHHLSPACERIGLLKGVTHHLTALHCSPTHYELVYYDLRLLFLITACGPDQRCTLPHVHTSGLLVSADIFRIKFREDYNGVAVLLQLLDSLLFPSSGRECCTAVEVPPLRDSLVLLPCQLDDMTSCNMVCEILKILFNQTVETADDEVCHCWMVSCDC